MGYAAPLFSEQPDVMTVPQVAELLGVSAITVRRELARGRLSCCHIGACVRITKQQLIDYVKEAN